MEKPTAPSVRLSKKTAEGVQIVREIVATTHKAIEWLKIDNFTEADINLLMDKRGDLIKTLTRFILDEIEDKIYLDEEEL